MRMNDRGEKKMKLSQLLQDSGADIESCPIDLEISGISYDSRKTLKGDLFVCVKGFKTDGHRYIKNAVDAGAAAILAQDPVPDPGVPVIYAPDTRHGLAAVSANFFERPSDTMTVFGVTGTNGKTTITYLMQAIMENDGQECGVVGTIAYVYGGVSHKSSNTTPESYELQRILHEMKTENNVNTCVMEVSSHSLALSRTDFVSFDYGIFTNLTEDHLDFHKDFEDYYQSKKKLFLLTQKMNVINIDDTYGKRLYRELKEAGRPVVSCSVRDDSAFYTVEVQKASRSGTEAVLFKNSEKLGVLTINTPGKFSISNAVCAAAAALEAGISWESVSKGIAGMGGVSGRFEKISNSKDMTVIVDYAHTPDALEKVINTAREFTEGRVITVFGCGGDRDSAKRPLMGEAAGKYSDYCVVTSDNPRTEDPEAIIDDIIPGIAQTGCEFVVEPDRREAIKKALLEYKTGDTVIIAGKGHETYQIIGKEERHFDDRETAREIIEQEI